MLQIQYFFGFEPWRGVRLFIFEGYEGEVFAIVRDEVFVSCDKGYVSLHERACDRLTARAFLATHRGRNAR